jgi:uncharacterized protein
MLINHHINNNYMEKNDLLGILKDWNFWEKDLNSGVRRDSYLKVLNKMLPSQQVKIITGARRSGKSFIMRQMAKQLMANGVDKKNILIVNFEDPGFVDLNTKLIQQIFNAYLEDQSPKGGIYIFLDEVQEIPRWEKWVRMTQELDKANMIISGSNSKLLSGELATVLTGRHLDVTIMPLSFKEFLNFKNLEITNNSDLIGKDKEVKKLMKEFLEFGSFPIVVLEEEKKKEALLNYYDDTVNRDLIKRYRIRKIEKLRSLIKFYLGNISSPITFASSGEFLKMSAETTERFSDYLESSYLVFFLKRFSYKFKEQEKSPRKVYAVDTGVASTIGFRFSPNLGKLAENAVFLELKRRAYLNPFLEVYYWKSLANEEVDFVVKEDTKIIELIQVCWSVADINTKKREIKALLKAMAEFKLKKGLIITEDFEGEEDYDGKKIQYVSLRRWLLGIK